MDALTWGWSDRNVREYLEAKNLEPIAPELSVEALATAFVERLYCIQDWSIPATSIALNIPEGAIFDLTEGSFDGFTVGVLKDYHKAFDRWLAANTAKELPTSPNKAVDKMWLDRLIPEGHIYPEVDGFYVFAPQKGFGAIAPWALRLIADHLDALNKPWQEELERSTTYSKAGDSEEAHLDGWIEPFEEGEEAIAAAKASLLKKAKEIL